MANQAIEIENLTKEYPYGFLNLKKHLDKSGVWVVRLTRLKSER